MRHRLVELVRAGAGRLLGIGLPVVLDLLGAARADHQDVADHVREQRVRHLGGEGDRVVVDLLDAGVGAEIGARLGELRRVELRRLLVGAVGHVPDHVVGGEVAAVVPFDALAQLEDPALRVGFVDLPFGGETGLDVGRLVGVLARQVPQHQRVVQVVADETVALETLVRVAGGGRQVARRHRDRQRARGLCIRRRNGQRRAEQQRPAPHPVACYHLCQHQLPAVPSMPVRGSAAGPSNRTTCKQRASGTGTASSGHAEEAAAAIRLCYTGRCRGWPEAMAEAMAESPGPALAPQRAETWGTG